MPKIVTNIFKDLTDEEKKEIELAGVGLGRVEIGEYVEKGFGLEEVIKFIFDGFVLTKFLRDALLWDCFKSLLQKVFDVVSKKKKSPIELQTWIRDVTNPAAINVTFSVKTPEDIHELLTSLRTKLDAEVFSNDKEKLKGKIIWMGFDRENKIWKIQIL
jgi:hypothetical protein